MTTTPNPTAAELAEADGVAALNFPFAASEHGICVLARCYRLLRHQLTLAANQTTARESAENTAEETMTDKPYDPYARVLGPPAQTPEPVEPSDEALAEQAYDLLAFAAYWGELPQERRDLYVAAVRHVKAVGYRAGLAAEAAARAEAKEVAQPSPLVTSDNEPPVPLPTSLPIGTRVVFSPTQVATATAELLLNHNEHRKPFYQGEVRWHDTNTSSTLDAGWTLAHIDWSHYRAQQRAAEPAPGVAWNYSEPPDSEIGKMHELLATEDGHGQSYAWATPMPYKGSWTWHGCGGCTRSQASVKAWRPASAAPAKGEHGGFPHRFAENMSNALSEPEPDSAWLKRTVEELTTARPVDVFEDKLGHLLVSTTGDEEARPVSFRVYVDERHVEGIRGILAGNRWPMRRNCIPDPSPQPGGFLDALTRRVDELEEDMRVVRAWAVAAQHTADMARIEREERERGK